MKKLLSLALILALLAALAVPACAEEEPEPFYTVDGDTISLRDDGTIQFDSEGSRLLLATTNMGLEIQKGDLLLTINEVRIVETTCSTESRMKMLESRYNEIVITISVDVTVENAGEEDLTFDPKEALIVTSAKEQLHVQSINTTAFEDLFLGGSAQQGKLFFVCHKTPADELTFFRLRLPAPVDENGVEGDKITFQFELQETAD